MKKKWKDRIIDNKGCLIDIGDRLDSYKHRLIALERKLNQECKCNNFIDKKLDEKIKEDLGIEGKDIDFFEWWKLTKKRELQLFYSSGSEYVNYIDGQLYVLNCKRNGEIRSIDNQDKYQLARAILIYEIDKEKKRNWHIKIKDINKNIGLVKNLKTKEFYNRLKNYKGINVWNWYFGIKED